MQLETFRKLATAAGQFHIEFRLRQEEDWPVTLDYWFGSPRWRDTGHQFDLIGVDSTGGLYCLWRYPGGENSPSPVVFLGSEGEGVCIVADNLADLARVLAQGYAWFGTTGIWSYDEQEILPEPLAAFRRQVIALIGPDLPQPGDVAADARRRHPDFKAWVDTQIG